MSLGLLLDAFLVRTMLVPALIIIVGEHSGWPGKRLTQPTPRTDRTLRPSRPARRARPHNAPRGARVRDRSDSAAAPRPRRSAASRRRGGARNVRGERLAVTVRAAPAPASRRGRLVIAVTSQS
jgi:RND superfamily putative drug exporter